MRTPSGSWPPHLDEAACPFCGAVDCQHDAYKDEPQLLAPPRSDPVPVSDLPREAPVPGSKRAAHRSKQRLGEDR